MIITVKRQTKAGMGQKYKKKTDGEQDGEKREKRQRQKVVHNSYSEN